MKLHSIKKKTLTFVLAMSLCAGGSFTVLAAEELSLIHIPSPRDRG